MNMDSWIETVKGPANIKIAYKLHQCPLRDMGEGGALIKNVPLPLTFCNAKRNFQTEFEKQE